MDNPEVDGIPFGFSTCVFFDDSADHFVAAMGPPHHPQRPARTPWSHPSGSNKFQYKFHPQSTQSCEKTTIIELSPIIEIENGNNYWIIPDIQHMTIKIEIIEFSLKLSWSPVIEQGRKTTSTTQETYFVHGSSPVAPNMMESGCSLSSNDCTYRKAGIGNLHQPRKKDRKGKSY